ATALRCPAAVLRDHATGECIAIAETGFEALLDRVHDDAAPAADAPTLPEWRPPAGIDEDAPEAFTDGVVRILDYLAAGDVFQANLSRGWRARFDGPLEPARLYARLREANPAPFAGLFAGAGWAVVSASPERLVSVRGDVVE